VKASNDYNINEDEHKEGELYKTELRRIQANGERIDAVVAKVFSLSREESSTLFSKRLVFVDGRLCEDTSYKPKHGELISVRGHGRMIYLGYQTTSKKGKLNIEVELYV
jgi:RNA-binding protein YlmH